MILTDVNVLVHAFREDAPNHGVYRGWLEHRLSQPEAFGISELVLSGFVRIATHPRVFIPPTPIAAALAFTEALRQQPNVVLLSPGARHWEIFSALCSASNATGNDVPDAYHAALAIEHACEWVTTDKGFAKFKGLKWRHPLAK